MSRWKSRARNLRALRLLRTTDRRVAYLGWLGHANLGDEAVFDAYRTAFDGLEVAPVPAGGRIADDLRRVRGRPLFRAVMLGGGTIIGTDAFRRELTRPVFGDGLPLYMLGTGVEDPAYEAPYARDFADELERWRPLLERCFRVTVRGPRSAEVLEAIGIDATVIGDPALLLEVPASQHDAGVIGVNVGVARHIYGQDPDGLMDAVVRSLNGISPEYELRLFSLWPPDDASTATLARRLSRPVRVISEYRDSLALMRALAECDVVIGMKLHFLVLAAAAGVPGLMLSYHPKCADFQASIGRERWTVRTDEATPTRLADDLAELLDDAPGHARSVRSAVEARRVQLRAEARDCLAHLAGTRPAAG